VQPSLDQTVVVGAFAEAKYPGLFDPRSGLLCHAANAQRLRPGSGDAAPRLSDPYASYFVRANPDHLDGTELVCAALVDECNFTDQMRRLLA
jgi:hypothetical protein